MSKYYDSKGNPYELAEKIGRGGEGVVYFCKKNANLVAKIYHEPITEEKAKKLRWMAENQHERLTKVAAWVVETLHEKPNGKMIGFLMPSIRAKEIHELYSLKSRRVHFPNANWNFLIHTAANVARAFYSLQKYDHIMGDVNHGNCVVLADGTVKLIDCDSYAIKADEMRYPCKVGVGTHLAPELQKTDLSKVERLTKHDNFGLAVIIFQLLFLGRHPFSGNYLGEKDKTLEDCIREYRFAYGKHAKTRKVKQPPGTLSLSEVSPQIAKLFERAFDASTTRPTPKEWIEALVDLSKNLQQCAFHPGHHFYTNLDFCPWCKIEGRTGLTLFPFNIKGSDGTKAYNIYTIENLLANINSSSNLPAKLPKSTPAAVPPPEPKYVKKYEQKKTQLNIILVSYTVIIFIIFTFIGWEALGFLLVMGILIYNSLTDDYESKLDKYFIAGIEEIKKELNTKISTFQKELKDIENTWSHLVSKSKSQKEIDLVKSKIGEYKKLQQKSVRELKSVQVESRRKQFKEHLQSIRLEDADISALSKYEKNSLYKKGITDATQIEEKQLLHHHNLDEDLVKKLIDWRKAAEQNFIYDSKAKIAESDKKKALKKTAGKRMSIEKEIDKLLNSIHSGSIYLKQKQKGLSLKSKEIAEKLAQLKSNLDILNMRSNYVTAFLVVSLVFPVLGIVVNESAFSNAAPPKAVIENTTGYDYEPPKPIEAKPARRAPLPYDIVEIPSTNITNKEIAEIPKTKRKKIAAKLFSEARLMTRGSRIEYSNLEQKLNFARRFDKNNVEVLNELGIVLYELEDYSNSLKRFNQVVRLNKQNRDAKNYIAMNYLQLKKYKEARKILVELTKENGSNSTYFNLGLANKGLKNYKSAAKAFQKALEFDKYDVTSHYELAFVYYKLKNTEAFNRQYSKLFDLNQTKARELLDRTYKIIPNTK